MKSATINPSPSASAVKAVNHTKDFALSHLQAQVIDGGPLPEFPG